MAINVIFTESLHQQQPVHVAQPAAGSGLSSLWLWFPTRGTACRLLNVNKLRAGKKVLVTREKLLVTLFRFLHI